jgi:chemotaxis protein MotB
MRRHRYNNRYNRRSDDPVQVGGVWLITFTDTMALMLTFFVMTFAMSNPERDIWRGVTQTLQDNFSAHYGAPMRRGAQDTISIERVNFNRALDLRYLETLLVGQLEEQSSLEGITLKRADRSIVLSFAADQLFEAGMDNLAEAGRERIYALNEILRRMKNRIEINIQAPVRTTAGWGDTLGRAASVSAALYDAGYTRPVMIRTATGPANSIGRVDIVIMEDDGNRVTVFDIGRP